MGTGTARSKRLYRIDHNYSPIQVWCLAYY